MISEPITIAETAALKLIAVDYEHDIDMQQLFAQLAVEFKDGSQWWLNDEEEAMLDEQNRPHRSISVIEDKLLAVLDLERIGQPNLAAMTPTELLVEIGILNPTNPQSKECAGVLRTYLGDPKRIQGRDKWRIPFAFDERGKQQFGPKEGDEYD